MKAFACSAVLLLAAPFVMAQDKMATDKAAKAPAASAQPMAAMGETVKVSAKVTAIDKAARLVALQTADGGETIIKVGPDARNFDQIKIGDVVNAEYQYAAVVNLKKGPGVRGTTEATSSSRAKAGEKPGGTILKEGSITANVVGVDADKGTITVKGPAGRVVQGKVTDKSQLKDVKVGDQVEVDYVASLAIQVVPGAPAAAPKK